MTDLTPVASLDPVIQIETNTLALGGTGNPVNQQAQALLNRTAYLEGKIDGLSASDLSYTPDGAGGVERPLAEKLDDSVSLEDYSSLSEALAIGKVVTIPFGQAPISVSLSDAPSILAGFERINPESMTTITLPAGEISVSSGNVANVGPGGERIRLMGAPTVDTTLTSIGGVSGGVGAYQVTINLTSAAGIVAGDYLKLDNVIPLLTLSGDNSVFRQRVAPNELLRTSALLGNVTAATGGGSISWASVSAGVLSDYVDNLDLATVHGQTRQINGTIGLTSAPITGAWTLGVTSSRDYFISRPNTGTIGTGGVSSATVTGVGSAFLSEANEGDMLLCDGRFVAITAIANDLSMTVSPAVTIPNGTPYSIITPGVAHEGTHKVLSVVGNQVVVLNKWAGNFPPPVNRVSGGEVKAIKTILKNTGSGDGLLFNEGCSLAWMNNIALVGSGSSSGTHGLALNGRSPEGPTQVGPIGVVSCGDATAVNDWGRGAFLGLGNQLQARRSHFCGNVAFGVWAMEDSTTSLRESVISGNTGRGLYFNAASNALITDAQTVGNGGDGLTALDGCTIYGEIPNFFGNAGMNVRLTGTAGFHVNEGVNAMAGLSGIFGISSKADVSRVLFAANARENIELSAGCSFIATEATSSGSRAVGGSGRGLVLDDSTMTASGISIVGNAGAPATTSGASARLSAPNAFTRGAVGGGVAATNMAEVLLSGGKPEAVSATIGARVLIAGVSPVPTISGPARINETANDGALIFDGLAAGFGVAALRVAGASVTAPSFFAKATAVHNFPSIAAGAQSTVDITVTGALTTGHTATASSNSIPAGLILCAFITSDNTVRVVAYNPTGSAIDPGNATLTVTVAG